MSKNPGLFRIIYPYCATCASPGCKKLGYGEEFVNLPARFSPKLSDPLSTLEIRWFFRSTSIRMGRKSSHRKYLKHPSPTTITTRTTSAIQRIATSTTKIGSAKALSSRRVAHSSLIGPSWLSATFFSSVRSLQSCHGWVGKSPLVRA